MAAHRRVPTVKEVAPRYDVAQSNVGDSLSPLIEAIDQAFLRALELVVRRNGGMALRVGESQVALTPAKSARSAHPVGALSRALAHVTADALQECLGASTAHSRYVRLALARRLLSIEIEQVMAGKAGAEAADVLLTTAQVASYLGVSRPYVSMLCDTGKLGPVTKTEGGHRRVRRSAVDAYMNSQGEAVAAAPSPREVALESGMYAFGDDAFVKASKRKPPTPPHGLRARAPKS